MSDPGRCKETLEFNGESLQCQGRDCHTAPHNWRGHPKKMTDENGKEVYRRLTIMWEWEAYYK